MASRSSGKEFDYSRVEHVLTGRFRVCLCIILLLLLLLPLLLLSTEYTYSTITTLPLSLLLILLPLLDTTTLPILDSLDIQFILSVRTSP